MTLLGGLFEGRSIEDPTMPISSAGIAAFLGLDSVNHSGKTVSPTSSLQMPAVWRAVNLLAGTGAALPLKAYKNGTREPAAAQLLSTPHPDMTPFELWETVYVHLLLWGNAYLQKVRNGAGAVVQLWPIHPSRVRVARVAPWSANPSGKLFEIDSRTVPYGPDEILHIPGLGYDGTCGVSPIRLASQGIGLALAAEEYGARLFSAGSMLSGVLQVEQRLPDQADADRLKANWRQKVTGLSNAHEIAILDSGAKFQPVSMPNTDAQFIESRSFQISEVARWFGVPSHMLMDTEKSTSWGTGIEQQSIGFVVYTLRPWLSRIEQRVTKEATPAGVYAKYKVEGLLRGDSAARAAFYKTMRDVGAFSANDILELEDMPGVGPEGDTRLEPLNMAPLGAPRDDGGTDAAA